ncbi:peptide chain release factor 1 [Candidatus Marinamargulisbacteria bacterium SCGC AAA071-K20]|nr:peptide chain release factor 1 [Candidatus Marinamargulisbacteria bacterium SCGC AAA071-K20]
MNLLSKFEAIEYKFQDLERRMSDPEIISDQKAYQLIVKQHAELEQGVLLFRSYKKVLHDLKDAEDLLTDPEMKEMVEEEIPKLKNEIDTLRSKIEQFLVPPDPNDHRNAVVEIRAGTGGDEACLFSMALFRMYKKYSENKKWKVEIISESITGLGGLKEISFVISGHNVYRRLKYESGTHRVQRVPDTESSGRIHTSASTVAILPEAEEVDVNIDTKDLRIDTYRASGAGGQHVNKTDSAVRITHEPTGIVVACQDERSQFQNKEKSMRMLRTKLYEKQVEDKHKAESAARKLQVGSGDRSQKIRTYNYPQKRVTDHRINFSAHELQSILEGSLDIVIEPLMKADAIEKLKE